MPLTRSIILSKTRQRLFHHQRIVKIDTSPPASILVILHKNGTRVRVRYCRQGHLDSPVGRRLQTLQEEPKNQH
jgi:hypothetical protein